MNNRKNRKPKLRCIRLDEFVKLPPKPTKPYRRSPWDFHEETLTLSIDEVLADGTKRGLYEVDLEQCATPAQTLDWIMQVSEKSWATDRVLASLVRDLNLYLGSEVCFGSGTTDVRATVRERMGRANVLRGKLPNTQKEEEFKK